MQIQYMICHSLIMFNSPLISNLSIKIQKLQLFCIQYRFKSPKIWSSRSRKVNLVNVSRNFDSFFSPALVGYNLYIIFHIHYSLCCHWYGKYCNVKKLIILTYTLITTINPNKSGIEGIPPTFVQNDFTPWC